MKMITLNRKKILVSILFVCFVWFGYMALGLGSLFSSGDQGGEELNPDVESREQSEHPDGHEVSEAGALPEILPDQGEMALGVKQPPVHDDYFVNYRIEREKIRSQQVEILREIVENPNSGTDVRKNAQEKMLKLAENMENELKLENLIKAKNYEDAVVLIQPESVMVVVKVMELTDRDGTKIADLVANTTGHSYENIIITTKE